MLISSLVLLYLYWGPGSFRFEVLHSNSIWGSLQRLKLNMINSTLSYRKAHKSVTVSTEVNVHGRVAQQHRRSSTHHSITVSEVTERIERCTGLLPPLLPGPH